mgnify:FL=1
MRKSLTIIFTLVSLVFTDTERGWQHPQTGWEVVTTETMSFYLIQSAYLDNMELEDGNNDVIGAFYENQNIGWEFYSSQLTIIPTTGDNGSMPNYPYEGAPITFKIYDSSSNQIIDAISLDDVPLWHIQGFNTIRNLYSCNQDFPILDNGECILDCIGDPSLDGQINIHDILMIVDLIIDCDSPFYCFDDNIECMDMNEDNIIDILDILYIVNNITR